jgi:hypothetical protein
MYQKVIVQYTADVSVIGQYTVDVSEGNCDHTMCSRWPQEVIV